MMAPFSLATGTLGTRQRWKRLTPGWRAVALLVMGAWWTLSGCIFEGQVLWSDGSTQGSTTTPERPPDSTSLSATSEPSESGVTVASLDGGTTGSGSDSELGHATSEASTSAEMTLGSASAASDDEGTEGPQDCVATQSRGDALLIDDLEDGDSLIVAQDGRLGWWYTQTDGTSEHSPPDPWGPTSTDPDTTTGQFAARLSGRDFRLWGATLGLTFNEECPYDASVSPGIEFWARGVGRIRFRVTTMATVPTDLDPGTCSDRCWDDFGTYIDLTESWTKYTMLWTDLSQEGWGEPAEFDPVTLLAIVWQGGGSMSEFDIWVDDIQFIDPTD